MILYTDKDTIKGSEQFNALAYVNNCNIDSTRHTMTGVVTVSLEVNQPDYTPYNTFNFAGVPYDPTSGTQPAAQFYEYLMTLEQFNGGQIYP